MPPDRLSPLQRRVLVTLADSRPRWTLTGGGALAGVHLGHRTTRDLDLFWRSTSTLEGTGASVVARLRRDGLLVETLQTSPAFQQLRVSDKDSVVLVDLVADSVPALEPPIEVTLDHAIVQVDSAYEILVNKLCALLGRSELRDLVDVRALIGHGLDFDRALRDAPRKDAGFSVLTLAWVLKQQPLLAMAKSAGLDAEFTEELLSFRGDLIQRLTDASRPNS